MRKSKRIAAAQETEKRSPRSMVKSHMTNRLKTYENRLFRNLKEEEIRQARKIKELSNSNADSLKDKYYSII